MWNVRCMYVILIRIHSEEYMVLFFDNHWHWIWIIFNWAFSWSVISVIIFYYYFAAFPTPSVIRPPLFFGLKVCGVPPLIRGEQLASIENEREGSRYLVGQCKETLLINLMGIKTIRSGSRGPLHARLVCFSSAPCQYLHSSPASETHRKPWQISVSKARDRRHANVFVWCSMLIIMDNNEMSNDVIWIDLRC